MFDAAVIIAVEPARPRPEALAAPAGSEPGQKAPVIAFGYSG